MLNSVAAWRGLTWLIQGRVRQRLGTSFWSIEPHEREQWLSGQTGTRASFSFRDDEDTGSGNAITDHKSRLKLFLILIIHLRNSVLIYVYARPSNLILETWKHFRSQRIPENYFLDLLFLGNWIKVYPRDFHSTFLNEYEIGLGTHLLDPGAVALLRPYLWILESIFCLPGPVSYRTEWQNLASIQRVVHFG